MVITRESGQEGKVNETFRAIVIIISVILPLLIIRINLAEYIGSKDDPKGLERALTIVPENARYYYLLGLQRYDNNDPDGSIRYFLKSLRLNPTDSKAWLELARSFIEKGNNDKASYALMRAIRMDGKSPDVIWEAGLLSLMNGNNEDASRLLRRYLSMMPSEQDKLYSILFTIGADSDFIIRSLLPNQYEFYKRYLYFLIRNRLTKEAIDLWPLIRDMDPERELYIRYCDFLIQSGYAEKATDLWEDFIKRFEIKKEGTDNIIWNGDFEYKPEGGCFDWRIGKSEGVKVFIDRDISRTGESSLTINFNGQTNPDISVASQVVSVKQGKRYRVTSYVRTENITTKNGVFMYINGHNCGLSYLRTEPLIGTNLWKRLDIEFKVPFGCDAVQVGIRRERSEKFDNKISGDAWIDSISMVEIKE